MISRLLRKTHRYIYFGSVLLCFSVLYPFMAYWSRNHERHFKRIAASRKLIGLISSTSAGFFYRFHYEQPIDWSKPYIICPNHTSYLDISAMVLMCPPNFSFIGKIELLKNLVTGIFFRTIDIPVDRNSKLSSFKAFKRAHDELRKGRSIVIFPEGGIGDEFPPQLHHFKSGPFRLSQELGIPIVPVIIHDAWKLYWDEAKQYGSKPGIVNITVLKPIDPYQEYFQTPDELKDHVYNQIKKQWLSGPAKM